MTVKIDIPKPVLTRFGRVAPGRPFVHDGKVYVRISQSHAVQLHTGLMPSNGSPVAECISFDNDISVAVVEDVVVTVSF